MFLPGRSKLHLQSVRSVVWRPVGDCYVLRQGSVIKEYFRSNEYQALFGLKKEEREGGGGVFDATVDTEKKNTLFACMCICHMPCLIGN